MFSRYFTSALLAASAVLGAPADKRKVSFDWGTEKVRGVSIGGWLVLEPFITPSIFQLFPESWGIVDEYTLCEKLGNETALATILKPHWDTWVTYSDFEKIANAGFNTVRIPVPFWAYDTFGAPYAMGAAPYLDAAIDWARGTGLKVLIDLHSAPKSQNGYDNSGQRLDYPGWLQGDSVEQTLQVVQTLADKYAQESYQDVIMGIEVLNEPAGYELDLDTIRQFFRDGYGNIRSVSDTTVVLHDAFQNDSTWNGFLTPSDDDAQNVALDHHEYQVFDNGEIKWTHEEHRQAVCDLAGKWEGADKWTFVGEWTAAMTDCALWLNGYGRGARYDGTYDDSDYVGDCSGYDDISSWDDQLKNATRYYIETQMDVFEKVQGWIFWNFKTENAAEWDMFKLLDAGVFPNPVTDRQFPAQCS